MQLKITYSRHKDLNVKGNNERSFDYTQAATAQPGSAQPSYGAANRGNPAPIASYNGPNADLLAGGGGAPLGPHEMPPTGPTPAGPITRSLHRQDCWHGNSTGPGKAARQLWQSTVPQTVSGWGSTNQKSSRESNGPATRLP